MARAAAIITSAYANQAAPSNPFTQVNFTPNKDVGVTSYDNAELIQAMTDVYHVAQQKKSLLLPLFNQRPMTALFHTRDTFNKVNFIRKTEEAPLHSFICA